MRTTTAAIGRLVLLAGALVMSAVAATAARRPDAPVAVSPGDFHRLSLVAESCPTFSWSAVAAASSYELVVYEVEAEGTVSETTGPQVATSIPGRALSWTPALGECLEPGRRYVWFVRAVGAELSDWSEGRVFEVASSLPPVKVVQASGGLQRYTASGGTNTGRMNELEAGREAAADLGGRQVETGSESSTPSAGVTEEVVAIASGGITIGGLEVVTSESDRDTLGEMSCADGELPKWSAGTTSWECGVDGDGVPYLAGNQLTLDDHTFHVSEGHESGLDADLLDGLESAAFMPAGADRWVDVTGDTMTGRLTVLGTRTSGVLAREVYGPGGLTKAYGVYGGAGILEAVGVAGEKTDGGAGYLGGQDFGVKSDGNLLVENGNVGIGTNVPSAKLDVSDLIRVRGSSWPSAGSGASLEAAYSLVQHKGYVQVYDRDAGGSWGSLFLGTDDLHWVPHTSYVFVPDTSLEHGEEEAIYLPHGAVVTRVTVYLRNAFPPTLPSDAFVRMYRKKPFEGRSPVVEAGPSGMSYKQIIECPGGSGCLVSELPMQVDNSAYTYFLLFLSFVDGVSCEGVRVEYTVTRPH